MKFLSRLGYLPGRLMVPQQLCHLVYLQVVNGYLAKYAADPYGHALQQRYKHRRPQAQTSLHRPEVADSLQTL